MSDYTATYSPEDNKLRLYSVGRLGQETYDQARALGFRWAPKQELWVAPMWTPEREDFLTELAGEVGDEDTSLVDRAEERAERFEDYSAKRAQDADSAHKAVSAIADNIPLGQPILVGHHSERRARKDAERIDNGMRKAVKMWETSKYWVSRAKGAIRHAKYKERPDVRHRRIKGLEADVRKCERDKKQAERALAKWLTPGLTHAVALRLAGCDPDCGWLPVAPNPGNGSWSAYDVLRPEEDRYKACPALTVEDVQAAAQRHYPAQIAVNDRWLAHLANRLTYERTMLDESGWTPPPKPKTKADLPLLNVRGPIAYRDRWNRGNIIRTETVPMTKVEFAAIDKDYKGTQLSEDGTHRLRSALVGQGYKRDLCVVFLTDSKEHEAPSAAQVELIRQEERATVERAALYRLADQERRREAQQPNTSAQPFEAMRETLRNGGVQVVSAPQLFPTPPDLAARMVDLAQLWRGAAVLEPSAGTGRLLDAIGTERGTLPVVAVEINGALAMQLRDRYPLHSIRQADFLACNGDLGTFDRIVMNPPFSNGDDIKHILHARSLLRPSGLLVALCANGPRQAAALQPLAESWEPLPAGTFEGTGVSVVLLTMGAEDNE